MHRDLDSAAVPPVVHSDTAPSDAESDTVQLTSSQAKSNMCLYCNKVFKKKGLLQCIL